MRLKARFKSLEKSNEHIYKLFFSLTALSDDMKVKSIFILNGYASSEPRLIFSKIAKFIDKQENSISRNFLIIKENNNWSVRIANLGIFIHFSNATYNTFTKG